MWHLEVGGRRGTFHSVLEFAGWLISALGNPVPARRRGRRTLDKIGPV